jgi:hypothetical protein
MTFKEPISIKEIAKKIKAEIIGDDSLKAIGINEIHQVRVGDITFSDVRKYFDAALKSNATFLILNERVEDLPEGKVILLHPNPFEAYDSIVRQHRPFDPLSNNVADSAMIHESVIMYALDLVLIFKPILSFTTIRELAKIVKLVRAVLLERMLSISKKMQMVSKNGEVADVL